MQSLAKRRQRMILAKKKTQIIVKMFGFPRAGRDNQDRPPRARGNQR
jgi:hypothetical protein